MPENDRDRRLREWQEGQTRLASEARDREARDRAEAQRRDREWEAQRQRQTSVGTNLTRGTTQPSSAIGADPSSPDVYTTIDGTRRRPWRGRLDESSSDVGMPDERPVARNVNQIPYTEQPPPASSSPYPSSMRDLPYGSPAQQVPGTGSSQRSDTTGGTMSPTIDAAERQRDARARSNALSTFSEPQIAAYNAAIASGNMSLVRQYEGFGRANWMDSHPGEDIYAETSGGTSGRRVGRRRPR